MKNKSFILFLTIVVAILSFYYLQFTFVARSVEQEANLQATDDKGNVNFQKKQNYLDSLWKNNVPVYNFVGLEFTYKDIKEKELALGLDLQGGMNVTMEVSPVEIIKVLSGDSQDPTFLKALEDAKKMQTSSRESFVDLFYKSYTSSNPKNSLAKIFTNAANKGKIDFSSSDEDVLALIKKEVNDAVDRSFNILRTRIDKFGVANPNIQKIAGTGRILIELPGVENPKRVEKLLSGVAKLEFLEVWEMQELAPYLQQFNDYLVKYESKNKTQKKEEKKESKDNKLIAGDKKDTAQKKNNQLIAKDTKKDSTNNVAKKDSTKKDTNQTEVVQNVEKEDSAAQTQQSSLMGTLFIPTQQGLMVNVKDTVKANKILNSAEVRAIFPANLRFLWEVKPDKETQLLTLYAVKKAKGGKSTLEGDVIVDARHDFSQSARPEVLMQMNANGAKKWRKMTADNIGRRIAIVLDDYVYSAPMVQSEIPNGNSSISGNFTLEEAIDLANILKSGRLPAPLRIVENAIVGPSLGREAISQGLISTVAGLIAVFAFMFVYYSFGGNIANIALLVNVFFTFGVLTQLGTVLTLSGIAGIVLSIGMSVDANVLIYERLREELRAGKSMATAIRLGYDKALSAIIDSNATTFLVGLILYTLGTGSVRGFAVTLMIGIAISLFCAVFITRVIIEFLHRNPNRKPINLNSYFFKNTFKQTNFDFVKARKWAYAFSGGIIVLGLGLVVLQGGFTLGVDFKGGRSYVVRFSDALSASDARTELAKTFNSLESSVEVKTYDADNQLKITTTYLVDDESSEADGKVEKTLLQGLAKFNNLKPEIVSSSKVGSTIADDIQTTSQWAVMASLVAMFLYILFRFRNWQYGVGATIALAHNVLIVLAFVGLASAVGITFEIDQVFIAAILTVVGYSINDTVVVFDRIREFASDITQSDFGTKLNASINDTLSRTIVTGTTTIFVVIILLVFGGEVLRGFSFAMLIGIVFGTYSSIFVASPIVLDFAQRADNKKAKEVAKAN
ncbi:MAG: protein translocase subunit SecDF [Cytophagales bacterium]|nr:MAG: protein translocase subunit SecDF [Cytophagales bacterium]